MTSTTMVLARPPQDQDPNAPNQARGSSADMQAAIGAFAPDIVWHDSADGVLQRDGFLIDVALGHTTPITEITLHLHGGPQAADVANALADAMGWHTADPEPDQDPHDLTDYAALIRLQHARHRHTPLRRWIDWYRAR